MARVQVAGIGKEDLPEVFKRMRERMRDNPPDGGISDLDLEREARMRRMQIGQGVGAGVGAGAGAILGGAVGNPMMGAMIGQQLGQTGGQALGYNWKPVQDTWKQGYGKIKDVFKF
jgi:hypothetical protein